jgi:prevent-host-death family protein
MWLDVAMVRVKIAELKNNLSKYLRAAERGETIEVLDRDRPIARIVPVEQRGKIRIIPAKRPFTEVRDKVYTPLGRPGFDIVELLLDDRRKR